MGGVRWECLDWGMVVPWTGVVSKSPAGDAAAAAGIQVGLEAPQMQQQHGVCHTDSISVLQKGSFNAKQNLL